MYKIHSFKATRHSLFPSQCTGLVVSTKESNARVCDLIIEKLKVSTEDVTVDKISFICTTDDFVDPALEENGVYLLT